MTQKQPHVGIVGSGIIGICTALFLQREGFKVSLIDRKGIAKECSQGNAGHFATEQVFPLADKSLLAQVPKMLLDPLGPFRIKPSYFMKAIPWFARFLINMSEKRYHHNKTQLTQLNAHALAAYEILLEEFNLQNLLVLKGSILTFEKTPDKQIQQLLKKFIQQGVDVKWLSKAEVHEIEPNLSDHITSAFLFNTGGHTVDPEALCTALAEKFLAQGGKLIIDQIDDINSANGVILTGEMHSYHFDKIVIAAGAWSKKLVKKLGFNVPLDTERGYHVMLQQHNVISRPVSSAERKFIMTPMTQGLRLAGTVEFAGLHAPLNKKRAHNLIPHAQCILKKMPQAPISEPWMGFRPSLPDSLPVIGQSPKNPQVYFAFGHHHLGLTHGALTGKLIAEQMTNKPTTMCLKPFCISRFT